MQDKSCAGSKLVSPIKYMGGNYKFKMTLNKAS